jgi:hypothetical protein
MKPQGGVTRPGRWRIAAIACGVAPLTAACGSGSSTAVSGVVTAVGQVTTAAQQLFAAVGNDCPSGT